jgi:UDP-N-acetylglucosamine:LPS N-acetylglucosamine transferase/tetratricopeptide (TPR) repeat protein
MNIKKVIIFILLIFSSNIFAQNKVIILWYGMGKGHLIPAERIAEYVKISFQKRSEPVEVKLFDLRDYSIADDISEETGKRKYLDWAGKEADSYTQYFEYFLEKEPSKIKSNFDLYRIAKLLIKEKPSAIITVFWGAAHAIYSLKQLYPEILKTPTCLLYTDYGVRKFVYMVPTIEKIFFGSKKLVIETFQKYPHMNFYTKNFDFSGIPVNIEKINELKKENPESLKSTMGLNPKANIVTFARGGEVFLPMASKMEKTLNKADFPKKESQVVLLAGKASRDKEELEDLEKKYPGRVKVVGFIDNPTYLGYVRASDVFVTKPGGAGLTEAGLSGVPIIIIPGLGGQEVDNQNTFVNSGMALFEKDENKIVEKINTILNNTNLKTKLVLNQMMFFQNYDPSKIAEWAYTSKMQSDWDRLNEQIEKKQNKKAMQEKVALDPITLKNWFNYLNDVSQSDISKNRSFQKIFTEKSQVYIREAIASNKVKIESYKKFMADFKGPANRDLYIKKWKLFRAIILDNSLHINLNQTYNPPDRALLDQLTKELLQFLDTDIFAKDLGVYSVWEFSKGSLYTFLSEFYYLSRFYPQAQESVNLALKEFPKERTNESLIQIQADIFLRLKKQKNAIEFLKSYLLVNHDYDFVRINMAKILNDEKQVKEAIANINWLLERRGPGMPLTLNANNFFMIATIYLKNEMKQEALDVLLQGINSHPNSINLVSLAVRLISGDENLKKMQEKKLAELIEKYKNLKDIELKKLENLPLLIVDRPQSGRAGIIGM